MSTLRLILRLLHLFAVIALGALLAALISLGERLARHDLLALRQRISRWYLARLAGVLPFRVHLHGERPQTAMLWVSNHVSWTDIPLLGLIAPLSFLSKAEVRDWPLAGWLAHKAGTLFIRRGAGDSSALNAQLGARLQAGHSPLLFPEATTTDGRAVRTFHGRLLSSAIDNQVAVQPVAIRYRRKGERDDVAPFIGDDSMGAHLLRLLACEVSDVEITLLPPIASHGLNRNELARRAQAAISAVVLEAEVIAEARAEEESAAA